MARVSVSDPMVPNHCPYSLRSALDLDPRRDGLVHVELLVVGERGNDVLLETELVIFSGQRRVVAVQVEPASESANAPLHRLAL